VQRTLIVVGSILLSGCAGTDTQLRLLERENALRIEPISGKPYDYTVRLSNVIDFGYDPDNKETRDDTAMRAIRAQCPAGVIVGEDIIEKGTYAIGRQAREYLIQIKCDGIVQPPQASQAPAPAQRRKR
jgi:hypothetical protein